MARDPLEHPEEAIRSVYAYVAYRVGPGPDAEDITSEVFERAVRYRSSYDQRRGEPIAWLMGIARTAVNGAFGDRDVPLESVDEQPAPGDMADEAVRRLTLVEAASRLSDRDRELIALRYGAGLSGKQIGAILDMSRNAVDVAVHRAAERLREALGEPDESESR